MTLIVCRRCKKIVTSGAKSCPYCGESNPGEMSGDSDSRQGKIKSVVIAGFVIAFLSILLIQLSSKNDGKSDQTYFPGAIVDAATAAKLNCLASECPGGTKAVTYTTQQEPFYSCRSDELSEYANFVLGVMVKQVRYAENSPEISSKTGEPVVQGDDKLVLDKYRAKAGVSSFEEAIAKCYRGIGNIKVLVLYSPKEGNSIYVAAEDNQDNKLWMPKARVIKQ